MRLFAAFFVTLLCWSAHCHAQGTDTLTVMTYNLLYYRVSTSFCHPGNNPASGKDVHFRKIIEETEPDILVCTEMGVNENLNAQLYFRDFVLNDRFPDRYEVAPFQYDSTSSTANALYYNKDKLAFKSADLVQRDSLNNPLNRPLDFYKLYYRDPSTLAGDTLFLIFGAAHFKAGNSPASASQRTRSAATAANYILNELPQAPLFFCGDLNFYSSDDSAWKELTSGLPPAYRLLDPANAPGSWHENPAFAHLHSQSTHAVQDCFAGGGLDDRFDFILLDQSAVDSSFHLQYVDGSYTTFGQDSLHFDRAVNDTSPVPNQAVSSSLAEALYGASDHLPVLLKVAVDVQSLGNTQQTEEFPLRFNNPAGHMLHLHFRAPLPKGATLTVYDLRGRALRQEKLPSSPGKSHFRWEHGLPPGIYLLRLDTYMQRYSLQKLIIY